MKAKNFAIMIIAPIILSLFFITTGCNNAPKQPSPQAQQLDSFDFNADAVLVQPLAIDKDVKDIWGNQVDIQKFYAFTAQGYLIPTTFKSDPLIPGTKMSLEEYTSALKAGGNNPDTVELKINSVPEIKRFKVYGRKRFAVDASLN